MQAYPAPKVAKKLAVGKDTVDNLPLRPPQNPAWAPESARRRAHHLPGCRRPRSPKSSSTTARKRLEHRVWSGQRTPHRVRPRLGSQLRSERASAQASAHPTAHYTEEVAFTILDEEQRWGWDPQGVPSRYLQRDVGDDGQPRKGVDAIGDHLATWSTGRLRLDEHSAARRHFYTPTLLEEDEIDLDTADHADAEPADQRCCMPTRRPQRPAFAP